MFRIHLRTLLLASLAFLAEASQADGSLADGARVHPRYHGLVPARSDVVFSTRFKRPDAAEVAKAFGSTRIEWVYTTDKEFVASLKKQTPWFGGTLNANGPLPSEAGFARDFDGNILVAPWMKGWGGRWVTTTHPETQAAIAEQARRYIDLGVNSVQHDDPLLQLYSALQQAGDFNTSTLEGFPAFLATRADRRQVAAAGLTGFTGSYRDYLVERHKVTNAEDYRRRFRSFPSTPLWMAYIRSTVEAHFQRLRNQLNAAAGRSIAISMNLALTEPIEANRFFFLAPLADYAMSETSTENFPQMVAQAATARSLGIGFVPSIRPRGVAEDRVAIATLYALGGQPVVPWDVYVGNDAAGQAKRYFGRAEEFADLYRFVRSQRELFDGLETAAMVGVVVPVDRSQADAVRAVVERLVERQVPFAFVLLGGTGQRYRTDPTVLRNFKLLITTGPEEAFAAEDLKMLAAAQVPRMQAALMKNDQWADLQPFITAPGAERVRVLVRADPADADRLVVHVVDTARGTAPVDMGCRRRVGIKRSILGSGKIASIKWRSVPAGTHLIADANERDAFVTLQGCPLWGILDVRMQR